jgi:cytochrome c peroxidase
MKNKLFYGIVFGSMAVLALGFSQKKLAPTALQYPKTWPQPSYDFSKNPLSPAGIELGRQLFYDPILSRDSTVSCASCHLSFTAFTHVDHALSHGIEDRVGRRNSPSLMNLAWAQSFMWDGAVHHLDFQALAPISDPAEMDHAIEKVVQQLAALPAYTQRFQEAFGSSVVTGERVLKAIAQFELTLISAHSKYDRMVLGQDTFTVQEKNGYQLFQKNCARCHAEPFFTHFGFEKNGLPIDTSLNDFGRVRITQNPSDSLKFKVPTLRNIEFSAPYMHDGRFRKLREVLNHYATSANVQPQITLSDDEKTDLLAFLLTLTDKQFLFNEQFSFPKK